MFFNCKNAYNERGVSILKKLLRFLVGVSKEKDKIKWPTKKQLIVYSSATLIFMIIVGLFFTGLDLGFSYLKTLVG